MAVTETGHLASREVDDLYRQHGAEVYRYAYAVLGNHADAEDVTQTTFLNAYRSLEQGVRPRKPSNWLLTIASNAIKQRFRQEQARPRTVELDERLASHEADDDESPSVGELLTALSKIPPQQRQAIVLREFEGRPYAEIAEILGVTTGALETLLFRARRSLAEELQHQLTCTDAQLAVSKAADGRLGRKERRRLKDHLVECPDCAHFARLQKRHSTALRGLLLIPIPLSLSLFKGLEGAGTANAATLHLVPATGTAAGASTATTGVGAGTATGVGVGSGSAASGGFFAGGVAIKAAAAIVAVTVASGAAVTGALQITQGSAPKTPAAARASEQRLGQVAPRRVGVPRNGVVRGKLSASGAVKKVAAATALASPKEKGIDGSPGTALTPAHIATPEHTTSAPEQTTTPEHTTTPDPTAAPQQATTAPKPAATPRLAKGKRIAAAKRKNTAKPAAATPKPKAPSQQAPAGSNNGGNGTGADKGNSGNGSTTPSAGAPGNGSSAGTKP